MSFTAPALADFRATFPEFDGVDDALIQSWLTRAQLWLDPDVWANQAEYTQAVLYWTAHYVYLSEWQGVNGGSSFASSTGPTEADLFIASIRKGDRSVTYAQRARGGGLTQQQVVNSPGEGLLTITLYGQLFIQLRTRNIIPIAIM